MLRNWRAWVLIVLLVGPFVAYIGFGALWLKERGWLLWASLLWIASGVAWQYLATRWTKSKRVLMPPLDWDAPETFSAFDRQAWDLVQDEAKLGEKIAMEKLSEFDTYIDTGRRLAKRLAAHYHPLSTDPIESVPVVELLTALELASEDLNNLCRQVPGGDIVTFSHWKQAVQVSGYIQKANDWYSYLLPIISPMTGLPRLAARNMLVRPAWKNMQQNLMVWFFTAYVNRLGMHLIELNSGRLAIGSEQYRRLTRRNSRVPEAPMGPLTVAVAGARDSGKSRLIAAIDAARAGDLGAVRARLQAAGLDADLAERLRLIHFEEVDGYVARDGAETARERSTRRHAVEEATECDLLLLIVDATRPDVTNDADFVRDWKAWFTAHPGRECPPALVILGGADRPGLDGEWKPPHQWAQGRAPREVAVRARMDALRAALPTQVAEILPVGLGDASPSGVSELVLPALAALLHRADRAHLLRHIQQQRARSKAGRFLSQLGQQGRKLLKRPPRTPPLPPAA